MDRPSPSKPEAELSTQQVGRELAGLMAHTRRSPRALLERRLMAQLMDDPALRAAIFRFVDVRPACTSSSDIARHLAELLADAPSGSGLAGGVQSLARRRRTASLVSWAAAAGVHEMARRFIIGRAPEAALPMVRRLWEDGVATTVDLLGEATVTEAEADDYLARCEQVLHFLGQASVGWPPRPRLERDDAGAIARVNLSVKVSALTPLLRPHAPERAIAGAEPRLRRLLRLARDSGAHVHIDMESMDTREAVVALTLRLLAEDEFAEGPSAGIVLQAYLAESPEHLEQLLAWTERHQRASPLTVRLVKGAYWDHEMVQSTQHSWTPPVFTDRRACDRNFEALSRRLIDAVPSVRVAIASHNLRSVAHAAAYVRTVGLDDRAVEYQVLRGLGDDAQRAIAATGRAVRVYCPVGDLVAGMAYLVRRLLENTSNDSFLRSHALGADLTTLLEAP